MGFDLGFAITDTYKIFWTSEMPLATCIRSRCYSGYSEHGFWYCSNTRMELKASHCKNSSDKSQVAANPRLREKRQGIRINGRKVKYKFFT